MSNIVQKVKEAVSGHHSHSSEPEGTHGTHNSRVANAADPRIDSDRDHRAAPGSTVGGTHGYTSSSNYTHGDSGYGASGLAENTPTYGTTGHTGAFGSSTIPENTVGGYDGTSGAFGSTNASGHGTQGPHSSNVANKLDPRIDSDRSGQHMGNTAGDQFGSGAEGVHGPHSSRIANAADPRVDSDRDASRTVGNTYGSSGTHGTTGAHTGTHGTTGAHTGTHTGTHGTTGALGGAHGTTTHGGNTSGLGGSNYTPGPAANTAGPHKSDALNKMDPRVDSNLDGSKTIGGNKTYGADSKDPTDAAQVPPSVLQRAVGRPAVEHDDLNHGRERRHSLKSSQELHNGL